MSLIGLLVFAIVVGLVWWAVRTLGSAFGVPPPVLAVIYVILVVVCVLYLLQSFGLVNAGPIIRLH